MMPHSQTVDLTNCDREPIHIPGSIQTHGCLLACDAPAGFVLRHSANAADMLGLGGDINGRALSDLIDPGAVHAIRNALTTSLDASRPALLVDLDLGAPGHFNVSVHLHQGCAIIEFEAATAPGKPLQLARDLIGRIAPISDVDDMAKQTARLIHAMLGYDRVMVYRFENDGAGKVIAEAKRSDLESFLGQYFPASDIPQQARALYLRNTIRIITDASGARTPIVPVLNDAGEPLDLSFAHLRSVSPIHLEYLRNMGVAASMSISVVIDGQLWGLIACHHYSPRLLAMAERVAAEMFGSFFSLHLTALRQKRKLEAANNARKALDRFLREASDHTHIHDLLTKSLPDFVKLIDVDGIGLWVNGRWAQLGHTPPAAAIPALGDMVSEVSENMIWATDRLSSHLERAAEFSEDASGVLALPLSQTGKNYLFFFRKELVMTLDWAGNPEKSYETGPLGDRLTPRKSFAIWKETVLRQAQPWTEGDMEIAEAIRAAIVEVVLRHNELMADERAKADVRQRMLNEELNHRVKNILAVIKSLVGHPLQEGRTLVDYVTSLKGRIQALSVAHDQVVRGDGGGHFKDLLEAELSPFRSAGAVISLGGPTVWLEARAFSVIALVLHELATNAAKYGALSRRHGRLDVTWRLNDAGDCEIEWRESGGPAVTPPTRQGFGSALINRSIPYDLGGVSRFEFAPSGLIGHLVLPAKFVTATEPQELEPAGIPQPILEIGTHEEGPLVLLVEDQMLIAMDAEAMLHERGISRVTTCNSVASAMLAIQHEMPDVAILDVNLGSETSASVAEMLKTNDVPYIFATGYGDDVGITTRFDAPVVRKPYDGDTLLAALSSVLAQSR